MSNIQKLIDSTGLMLAIDLYFLGHGCLPSDLSLDFIGWWRIYKDADRTGAREDALLEASATASFWHEYWKIFQVYRGVMHKNAFNGMKETAFKFEELAKTCLHCPNSELESHLLSKIGKFDFAKEIWSGLAEIYENSKVGKLASIKAM